MPKAPPLTVAEVEKLEKSREIQEMTIKAKVSNGISCPNFYPQNINTARRPT
jgi:hypothetical protein